jgi:hypothetical protein
LFHLWKFFVVLKTITTGLIAVGLFVCLYIYFLFSLLIY